MDISAAGAELWETVPEAGRTKSDPKVCERSEVRFSVSSGVYRYLSYELQVTLSECDVSPSSLKQPSCT